MKIRLVTQADERLVESLHPLLLQLVPDCRKPSSDCLHGIAGSADMRLFVAEEKERIVGTLTLVFSRTLTASKAWIEDVVVDRDYRRRGIARALLREAVETARQNGIETLCLTSNPTRIAARTLYRETGFREYDTGVFKLDLRASLPVAELSDTDAAHRTP